MYIDYPEAVLKALPLCIGYAGSRSHVFNSVNPDTEYFSDSAHP